MPNIYTLCPTTGQPIDTGIDIDETSFERLPPFQGAIFCSHCGSEHQWSKDTAIVGDKPPAPR